MAETLPQPLPRTLIEATRYFSDPQVCIDFVAAMRWPNGEPICPNCGGTEHSYLTTRRLWKCRNKECHKQFSVKVGTIFEDSAIPLDKWLCSIWLIANAKNGISSHELGRAVGITQKSAWFVLHRIRLAMRTGSFRMLDGEVEVDETFVGGKGENKHESKKGAKWEGAGGRGKAVVIGAVERGGEVVARVIPDRKKHSLLGFVQTNVDPGAQVYSDEATAYLDLRWEGYKHLAVNHSKGEYAIGRASTNAVEAFWSLLKRGINGTYVQVDPTHLHRYIDERTFTFNERHDSDLGRFRTVLERISGRRLTWLGLTGAA